MVDGMSGENDHYTQPGILPGSAERYDKKNLVSNKRCDEWYHGPKKMNH